MVVRSLPKRTALEAAERSEPCPTLCELIEGRDECGALSYDWESGSTAGMSMVDEERDMCAVAGMPLWSCGLRELDPSMRYEDGGGAMGAPILPDTRGAVPANGPELGAAPAARACPDAKPRLPPTTAAG